MKTIPRIAFRAAIDSTRSPLGPWNISADDFPDTASSQDRWKFLLRYAVLAPSSHNTQPWLFRLRGDEAELYADRTRACRVVDQDDRELILSCGCALYHLRVAMAHFGCRGGVSLLPDADDPDLLARITMGSLGEGSPGDGKIFGAIPKRRTNRQPFTSDPVPPALLGALDQAAQSESTWLWLVDGDDVRRSVTELIAEGDRRQWANKRFRLELAAWVHPNRSSARDGIPGYAQGVDDLLSYAGPLVVRTFDMGEGQAAKDQQLATGSPVLAVLGTDADTPRDWLQAGQSLARVLLRARVEEVWASFLNQAIELPDLRRALVAAIGRTGFPQVCLRLGFGDDIRPTLRRDVGEILI